MWRIGIFTLAVFYTASALREVRPVGVNPSAISNIELLIPLEVSTVQEREINRADTNDQNRDEPYSAIPAYAFTLDTDTLPVLKGVNLSPTNVLNRPLPELIPSHSLYLSDLKQRAQDTEKAKRYRSDKEVERLKEEKLNGCRALADQHYTEAREVLLYLCTELVGLLSSRCDCCEEKQRAKNSKSTASGVPWSGLAKTSNHYVVNDNNSDNRFGSRVSVK